MAPNTRSGGDVCVEDACNNLALDAAFEVAASSAMMGNGPASAALAGKQEDDVIIFFDWGTFRIEMWFVRPSVPSL